MEFGLFTQTHVPEYFRRDNPDAEHERLEYEIEMVKAADRTGFKYVWASEHHFLDEYSHLSANEAWLGYMAAKTERIHLGSGIFNVTPPVNHPARIAERVAMLDHLSEGRFEFGTGRGSSTTEQGGFGIDDPELTREMWDEVMPEFKRMWSETDYSFDGKYFSMPTRNVLPKPYEKPHPPMWVACGSPSTFEKAGRLGLGALGFTFREPAALKPMVEAYKEAIQDPDPIGDYVNDNVTLVSNMLCMEDGDAARHWLCNSGSGYFQSNVYRYLDTFPRPPGIPEWPEVLPDMTPELADAAIGLGALPAGTPDECARGVQAFADTGADQLVFGMTMLPLDIAIGSLELFGREVIPRFDTDPVHRSTRMREAAGVSAA
jgi:alkanesulfonate monooxygenase SsuD/methylene tetrahydromethanopterin reductase-like flavin-dependent oxidoreductase (luciferase family)